MNDFKRLLFYVPRHSAAGDAAITLLRIALGLTMFLAHGIPKVSNYLMLSAVFPDPYGISGTLSLMLVIFAEFFCSLLLIVGLMTRVALIPLTFTMFTAFFVVHKADPFAQKELALIYLVGFIVLFITGPGRISIDEIVQQALKEKNNQKPQPNNQNSAHGDQD
ncbi:MAG: DoxX family protein [Bacteroidales bacterium]|jgi:putative oxidoreductase|nr:DoxX family protein [Bacteroidales bacterium]NPV36577.1 DoxX family protein [Bacteroidales bacterium]